jgi:hypothetical protein
MINNGIDQQVQQKVDAYRSKPQLLQQRYAQNKELIDLLALQKLKSEKDAVARDMQMQMQQNPQTIKDQLETEMVQRTKQDMMGKVGQVKGVLDKRQTDQMRRAKQMGIATAPAPNMARMANGGIVGFAGPQGSQVRSIEDVISEDFGGSRARAKKRFLELENKGRGSVRNLTLEEAREFESLRGEFEVSPIREGISSAIEGTKEFFKEISTPTTQLEEMGTDEEDAFADQPEPAGVVARPPIPTEDETDYLDGGAETPATPAQQAPESGIAAALGAVKGNQSVAVPPRTGVSKLEVPTTDYTKADALSADLAEAFKKDSTIDPSKMEEDEYKKFLERVGYGAEDKALRQKRIDELEAIRAKRMDPEALRGEELSSFLRGMAGRSTTGMALAGGSAGAARARKAAQQAETGLLGDVMGAETDLMKELAAQRLGATEQSITRAGQAELRRGRGLEGLAGLSQEQARRAEDASKRLLETNIANLEAGDRDRKMELEALISNASTGLKRDIAVLEGSIAQEKNRLTADSNAALRESTDKRYAEQVLGSVNNYIASISQKYDKLYTDRIKQVPMIPPFAGDEKAINAEIARLQKERDEQLATTLQDLQEQRVRLENSLSGGESGFSARRVQ